MDPIYIVTGLFTIVAAVVGLILTCYLERRALAARRNREEKRIAAPGGDSRPVASG